MSRTVSRTVTRYLPAVTAGLLVLAIYAAFFRAPLLTAGWVAPYAQKIFYLHVPVAWTAYLAFMIVFVCSILYLSTGRLGWDVYAKSAAELGVLFCTLAIITGSIWARAEWGVYWRMGDTKLMLTLVLWLVYVAYMVLRSNVAVDVEARLAAVFGILGFVAVPLSFVAQRLWRSLHPTVIATPSGGMAPEVSQALFLSLGAFTALFALLFTIRVSMERLERSVARSRAIRMYQERHFQQG